MIHGRCTARVFRVKTPERRRVCQETTQFPNFFVVFVLFVVNPTFLLPLTTIAPIPTGAATLGFMKFREGDTI
jgi:hypothetical protein